MYLTSTAHSAARFGATPSEIRAEAKYPSINGIELQFASRIERPRAVASSKSGAPLARASRGIARREGGATFGLRRPCVVLPKSNIGLDCCNAK
jgi:hypothetical protein